MERQAFQPTGLSATRNAERSTERLATTVGTLADPPGVRSRWLERPAIQGAGPTTHSAAPDAADRVRSMLTDERLTHDRLTGHRAHDPRET
jgi:hypothetical protein